MARDETTRRRILERGSYRLMVRTGLVAFGIVHLLIGWFALQLGFGISDHDLSQMGAFEALGETPLGPVLIWGTAAGLLAVALWQFLMAASGYTHLERKRTMRRIASMFRGFLYLGLGVSAGYVALRSSGLEPVFDRAERSGLTPLSFGQFIVAAVGIIVIVSAFTTAWKGIGGAYDDELVEHLHGAERVIAVIGHVVKGIALLIVGGMFLYAAVTVDVTAIGGLNSALRAIWNSTFGVPGLVAAAVGFGCYGLYCFWWAKRARFS